MWLPRGAGHGGRQARGGRSVLGRRASTTRSSSRPVSSGLLTAVVDRNTPRSIMVTSSGSTSARSDDLAFMPVRLRQTLDVDPVSDPVDVWQLRDHLQQAVLDAGVRPSPIPCSVTVPGSGRAPGSGCAAPHDTSSRGNEAAQDRIFEVTTGVRPVTRTDTTTAEPRRRQSRGSTSRCRAPVSGGEDGQPGVCHGGARRGTRPAWQNGHARLLTFC